MTSVPLEKFANALIPTAAPAEMVGDETRKVVDRFARRHGGLWVGGKVTAGPSELSFIPNALNRELHVGIDAIHIPRLSIRSVRREFGWLTGIVVVEHDQGEFRFRCFGARQVAAVLSSQ
jgi:hypothetical protein